MTESRFAVIRYVPDPLTDEHVNIGVVVFGRDGTMFRFIEDWRYVERFARHQIAPAVTAFVSECRHGNVGIARIEEASAKWMGMIQVSELRTALVPPEELLDRIGEQYLARSLVFPQPPVSAEPTIRKRAVRRRLIVSVSDAVAKELGTDAARSLVHANAAVEGALRPRKFDLVVRNGSPIYAASAFSFETRDPLGVLRQIEHTAFEIEDVRRSEALKNLPVAVLLLQSSRHGAEYNEAVKTIESVAAKAVPMGDLRGWSHTLAQFTRRALDEHRGG